MEDYKCPICGGDIYDLDDGNKKCNNCGTTFPNISKSNE